MPVCHGLFTLLLSPPKPANDYTSWNSSRKRGFSNSFCIFTFSQQFALFSIIAPQSGIMPSRDHRLNSWSQHKSTLFTLFILLLWAWHILRYCSSLNLPPLNRDVTNFQGYFSKISVTHPLPSIIYSPSTWYICLVSAQNSHTVYTSYLMHKKILFLY